MCADPGYLRGCLQAGNRSARLNPALGCATVAGDVIRYAKAAGLKWLLPSARRHGRHRPGAGAVRSHPVKNDARPQPDRAALHHEKKAAGGNAPAPVGEEYRSVHPDGHGYPRFCVAGGRMFVANAGTTLKVINGLTSEVRTRNCSSLCLPGRASPMPKRPGPQTWLTASARTARAYEFPGGPPHKCDNPGSRTAPPRLIRMSLRESSTLALDETGANYKRNSVRNHRWLPLTLGVHRMQKTASHVPPPGHNPLGWAV